MPKNEETVVDDTVANTDAADTESDAAEATAEEDKGNGKSKAELGATDEQVIVWVPAILDPEDATALNSVARQAKVRSFKYLADNGVQAAVVAALPAIREAYAAIPKKEVKELTPEQKKNKAERLKKELAALMADLETTGDAPTA